MDDLERDLEQLDLTEPPPWVKARAMVAAENAFRKQARRSRRWTAAVVVMVVGTSALVAGSRIADLIAPIFSSGPVYSYPPPQASAGSFTPDIPHRSSGAPAYYYEEPASPQEPQSTEESGAEDSATATATAPGEPAEESQPGDVDEKDREDPDKTGDESVPEENAASSAR